MLPLNEARWTIVRRGSVVLPFAAPIVSAIACNAIVGNEGGTFRPGSTQVDGGASSGGSSSGGSSGGPTDGGEGGPTELGIDAGAPVVSLARSPRLFTTGTWLYFTDDDGGGSTTIRRMPAQGGAIQVVIFHGKPVADLATDDSELLFSTATCPGEVIACTINSSTGQCGSPRLVAATQAGPRRVTLDAAQFAWANGSLGCGTEQGTAMRAARPSGAPSQVRATFSPFTPAAVARFGGATAIGVRKPDDPTTGYVMLCTDAKACTVVGSGPGVSEIVAADDSLFWIGDGTPPDYTNGAIVRGTTQVSSERGWAENQRHPEGIAVDGTYVYWTTNDAANPSAPGTLARCSRTDACIISPPQVLTRPLGPKAVVVDDAFITFAATAPPGFGIFRIAK